MTSVDRAGRPAGDRSRHDASTPHFVRGGRPARDQLPEHPDFLWRNPEPKRSYDVVIVGGWRAATWPATPR